MFSLRRSLIAILLVLLVGSSASMAAARPAEPLGKRQLPTGKARLTWTPQRLVQAVQPGQTVTLPVTFTSSADLQDVTLHLPGALGQVMRLEPASFAQIKAGATVTVKLIVTMPTERAHTRAGIVQVRAGNRIVPRSLSVKLTVGDQTDKANQAKPKPEKDKAHPVGNDHSRDGAAHPGADRGRGRGKGRGGN